MRLLRTAGISLQPGRCSDPVGYDFLAAPGRQDHIGCSVAHGVRGNDPVLGGLLKPQFWQHVFAAGDLDQFGHPADAADERIVPFLEIHFWPWGGPGRCRDHCETRFIAGRKLIGAIGGADQRTEGPDHRQNPGDVTLVEDVDGNARSNEVGNDAGLKIGKGEHQIRLQRQDLWNVCGDEGRHPRLLAAHLRRPHRIAGDADDAVLLTEQIQRLHGLFGEADDPAGRELAHRKRLCRITGALSRQPLPRRSLPDLPQVAILP